MREGRPIPWLFLLHGIVVADEDRHLTASGGTERVLLPWSVAEEALEPVGYEYTLPEGSQRRRLDQSKHANPISMDYPTESLIDGDPANMPGAPPADDVAA